MVVALTSSKGRSRLSTTSLCFVNITFV